MLAFSREARDEVADRVFLQKLGDRELLALYFPASTDCQHGCNGSPCDAESCTFTCHDSRTFVAADEIS